MLKSIVAHFPVFFFHLNFPDRNETQAIIIIYVVFCAISRLPLLVINHRFIFCQSFPSSPSIQKISQCEPFTCDELTVSITEKYCYFAAILRYSSCPHPCPCPTIRNVLGRLSPYFHQHHRHVSHRMYQQPTLTISTAID